MARKISRRRFLSEGSIMTSWALFGGPGLSDRSSISFWSRSIKKLGNGIKATILDNGLSVITQDIDVPGVVIVGGAGFGGIDTAHSMRGLAHLLGNYLLSDIENPSLPFSEVPYEAPRNLVGETSIDRTALICSVPEDFLAFGLKHICACLANPLFDEKSFKKVKRKVVGELEEKKWRSYPLEDLSGFVRDSFYEDLNRRVVFGEVGDIMRISHNDVVDAFKMYYVPNNVAITVVGRDINHAEIVEEVSGNFKDKKSKKVQRAKLKEKNFVGRVVKMKKFHPHYLCEPIVVFGEKVGHMNERDYFSVEALRGYLDVMLPVYLKDRLLPGHLVDELLSGPLIGSWYEGSGQHGLLGVYSYCEREKFKEMEDLMVEICEDAKKKISSGVLRSVKNAVVEKFYFVDERFGPGDIAKYLFDVKMAGGEPWMYDFRSNIDDVKADDVERAARKYLDTKNYVFAAIAPKPRRKLGPGPRSKGS